MKPGVLKDGILVTVGSLLALAVAFLLYFLIFMFFERITSRGASYGFVAPLRLGYGVVWICICMLLYRTRISDWLKACILTGSLTTFMVGIGVMLFERPIVAGFVMLAIVGAGMFLLYKTNKKWYHYYAVSLSIIAALFYL